MQAKEQTIADLLSDVEDISSPVMFADNHGNTVGSGLPIRSLVRARIQGILALFHISSWSEVSAGTTLQLVKLNPSAKVLSLIDMTTQRVMYHYVTPLFEVRENVCIANWRVGELQTILRGDRPYVDVRADLLRADKPVVATAELNSTRLLLF